MSGVLEEIAFAHERQEAEFEFAAVPLFVSFPLFGGEYPPVDLLRDIKCVVDQMSSRNIALQVNEQALRAIISFWSISMMRSTIS